MAFITMGIGVSVRTAFSLLFPPILDEFGWDRGTTAAAFSIGFAASALYAPLIGVLMDRLGPRYVISAGALIVSSGMVLATQITAPWQLYLTLGLLVTGGSITLSYIGHGAFLHYWFVKKRGLAIGIAFSGVGVGSMLLFPWLQNVIDVDGWRAACRAMAVMMIIVVVPLNLLLQRQRPSDLGLFPDGEAQEQSARASGGQADNIVDPAWANKEWTLWLALKTTRFWWLFTGFFCVLFAWYAVQVHQTRFLFDTGFTTQQAAVALGLVPLLGIFGQIVFGHFSDRVGREWGWTIGCLGFALCFAALLATQYYPSIIFVAIMVAAQGILGHATSPNYGSIPAELFQGKHYGVIFGVVSIAATLGPAAGVWVMGEMYDYFGDYVLSFWLSLALSLFAILCIWMAAPRKVRLVAGRVDRLKNKL